VTGAAGAVVILRLVVLAALNAWVLEAIGRTAWQYVRSGAVLPIQARRMMWRGAIGLGTCAVWDAVDQAARGLGAG
jgi:hypothetical protein